MNLGVDPDEIEKKVQCSLCEARLPEDRDDSSSQQELVGTESALIDLVDGGTCDGRKDAFRPSTVVTM